MIGLRAILAAFIGLLSLGLASAQSPQPFQSSRELLAAFGMADEHFAMFMDGQPADRTEQEPLLRTLFAVRRAPREEIEQFARDDFQSPATDASGSLRGETFRLRGAVRRVAEIRPPPSVRDRYQIDVYYRCQVVQDKAQQPAIVFALAVPRDWPRDEDFDQRVSLTGIFLKVAGESSESAVPVFVADRLAWHPKVALGDLSMDCGLFDGVQNGSEISATERECFYQLLAAAGRADPRELFAGTELNSGAEESVVPIFNAPGEQHGKLFAFTGTARRALRVKLDPQREAAEIKSLGADHYYQVELFTSDSQGNPLVFCLRELPLDMPLGPDIFETVRIPGFFFKTWAYRLPEAVSQGEGDRQLAPLLIGHQLRRIPAPANNRWLTGSAGGSVLIVLLICASLGAWVYRRSDRRHHARVLARMCEPGAGK